MPVYKDLGSTGMLYYRSYGGSQMLVERRHRRRDAGRARQRTGRDPEMDYVLRRRRAGRRAIPVVRNAGLASSWTGVYDVTPDWNPVLGRVADMPGLIVAYGFSGHGFKLSPSVGRVLAQEALGLATDVSLAPYSLERFRAAGC